MRREQRKATITRLIWTAILAVLIFAGSRNLRCDAYTHSLASTAKPDINYAIVFRASARS